MARFPSVGSHPDRYDSFGVKICRNCENPVAKGRSHYCSDPCRLRFFRDHHWPSVREDVLTRDNRTCSICSKRKFPKHLDIDHIIPLHMGGQPFDKLNLRTLCKDCHKAKTRLDREALGDSYLAQGRATVEEAGTSALVRPRRD